jgi:hypothetical protein
MICGKQISCTNHHIERQKCEQGKHHEE